METVERRIGEVERKGEIGKEKRERGSPTPPTVIIEGGVVDLF